MIGRVATVTASTLAGLTCAHLLRGANWHVSVAGEVLDRAGAILLRPDTARLLCALWGDAHGALLHGAHRLRGRRVRWAGADSFVVQPGLVIPLAPLLRRLRERLVSDASDPDVAWTVAADAAAAAPLGPMRRFGVRSARITTEASPDVTDEAVLEQTDAGWTMLLPHGDGWATRQVITLGATAADVAGDVPAMPRLRTPAARAGLIAVGEAALGLDPLCGDGAGHALRGAWAAAEALRRIADCDDAGTALRDYDAGLAFALGRHRDACARHYGACGLAWGDHAA